MRAISLAPDPTDREPLRPDSGSDSFVGSARLFFHRGRNSGPDPVKTVQRMMPFLERHGESRLIVGGIRKPEETVSAGGHMATITSKVLNRMIYHPKTEGTTVEFDGAWKEPGQNSSSIS